MAQSGHTIIHDGVFIDISTGIGITTLIEWKICMWCYINFIKKHVDFNEIILLHICLYYIYIYTKSGEKASGGFKIFCDIQSKWSLMITNHDESAA